MDFDQIYWADYCYENYYCITHVVDCACAGVLYALTSYDLSRVFMFLWVCRHNDMSVDVRQYGDIWFFTTN